MGTNVAINKTQHKQHGEIRHATSTHSDIHASSAAANGSRAIAKQNISALTCAPKPTKPHSQGRASKRVVGVRRDKVLRTPRKRPKQVSFFLGVVVAEDQDSSSRVCVLHG